MGDWQNGLFGCFSNCTICIITWFVPCYTAGKVAETVDESCLLCGLLVMVPIANLASLTIVRGKVRESKGIEGSLLIDFLTIWCCVECALCQEAQETAAFGQQALSMDRE